MERLIAHGKLRQTRIVEIVFLGCVIAVLKKIELQLCKVCSGICPVSRNGGFMQLCVEDRDGDGDQNGDDSDDYQQLRKRKASFVFI